MLDEMEATARAWLSVDTDMRADDTAEYLARALLAVLPVVRAASQLADIDEPRKMSLAANAYRVIEHGRREAVLIKAIEGMRDALHAREK